MSWLRQEVTGKRLLLGFASALGASVLGALNLLNLRGGYWDTVAIFCAALGTTAFVLFVAADLRDYYCDRQARRPRD